MFSSCLYCLCLPQRWRWNMSLSTFHWHYLKYWSSFSVLFLLMFFVTTDFCTCSSAHPLCPVPAEQLGSYKLPFWLPANPLRCRTFGVYGGWGMCPRSKEEIECYLQVPCKHLFVFQRLWMFNYQCARDQVWSPINRAFVWECVHQCELKVFLWLWILMNCK